MTRVMMTEILEVAVNGEADKDDYRDGDWAAMTMGAVVAMYDSDTSQLRNVKGKPKP